MLKACGLGSGAARLLSSPTRAPCATRVSRSFASTVHVSRDRHHLNYFTHTRPLTEFRDQDPPSNESDQIRHDDIQEETLPSAQPIKRAVRLGGEIFRGDDSADDDQIEIPVWNQVTSRKARKIDARLREPQKFHEKIHPIILENLMGKRNMLLRMLPRMPVYDSTFDAVLSGRNLFMQVPGGGRWLQWLLPLGHKILEHGVWRPRRVPEPEPGPNPKAASPERPSEVLVICPTLAEVSTAALWGSLLIKNQVDRLEILKLGTTVNWAERKPWEHKIPQCNVLISTPEILLQCLAIPKARACLLKTLQDVKTVVVDGKGKFLRRPDFLKMLDGVMDDIPLQRGTQRIVITDEHDPDLNRHLEERFFLSGDYEFLHDPRLDEIQAIRKPARRKWREEYNRQHHEQGEWKGVRRCWI